jgi:hypothetical protein
MSKLVVVACRLPHGILAEVGEHGAPEYKAIKINGIHSVDATGKPSSIVHNDHAFTQVPEQFWKAFCDAHKGAPYLVNRLVYAEDSLESAQTATELEEAKGKSGFEPLDPDQAPQGIEVDQKSLDILRKQATGMR